MKVNKEILIELNRQLYIINKAIDFYTYEISLNSDIKIVFQLQQEIQKLNQEIDNRNYIKDWLTRFENTKVYIK